MTAALDFSKLNLGNAPNSIIDPRKLFPTLPRKSRFKRPSDNQGEVLDGWFATRDQKDHTLKMNTGAGKTLIGLLILQSSLNEGVGPAVYVTPDPYLLLQVVKEAADLGIKITEDERSPEFLGSKAILVVAVKKLFNGRSTFGIGPGNVKLKIGTLVIDDAHACLSTVQNQFSIRLDSSHPAYKSLLSLFKDSLAQQSAVGVVQLEQKDPSVYIALPFWTWKSHIPEVAKILIKYKDDEFLGFTWPLLSNSLELCQCIFGGQGLEIAPRCLPIDEIPSFHSAKRRIYMTATLADDSVLISSFDADPDLVSKPVRPKGAGDMGDRMILVPQRINPKITDEQLRSFVAEVAKSYNVSVIVPSTRRQKFWEPIANQMLDASSIEKGVARLKNGEHAGVTILLNRYDGIDLPDAACRLLVIDGVPEVYGLAERAELIALEGTETYLIRQIQRIEQGMGRGVRSSEDFCVVLLTGRRLIERLISPDAVSKFSSATQAQLALGDRVTEQLAGKTMDEIRPVIDLCLTQDAGWVASSRAALASAPDGVPSFIDPTVVPVRKAFNSSQVKLWQKARESMQVAVNSSKDRSSRGYLLQQLAEIVYHMNQAEAQDIQFSAVHDNPRVLKPLAGVTYSKLASPALEQAAAAVEFMKQFVKPNELIIWVNSVVEDLSWDENATERFERGIQKLGEFLGFGSQRPEAESGKGPDNLWAVGELNYFVIECKSGAVSPVIGKTDCNQLIGSMQWFASNYDSSCNSVALLIHPSDTFDKHSSPMAGTKIVNRKSISYLKSQVADYASAVSSVDVRKNAQSVASLLRQFGFNRTAFVGNYATSAKISSK